MHGIKLPSPSDFQALFEGAPALYLILDPDLNIVAASDAYLRATMTTREGIIGRHLFDVFPDNPDDAQATGVGNLKTSLKSVLESKLPNAVPVQQYDIRRPESEGGAFEVRYWSLVNTPLLDAAGDVRYIFNRVEDVTDLIRLKQEGARKDARALELLSGVERMQSEVLARAEEVQAANHRLEAANQELAALRRQSEEKNAQLMATARDAKFVLDGAGIVVEVNAEGERMLARQADDIIGHELSDFFPTTSTAHGSRLPRPDAPDAFVDIASEPVRIGQSDKSLFVAREVTDRVKLEEQLRQSQKLEAIGQLTGGVAHDFNNLLTVIATASEMLTDRLKDEQSLLPLVTMIDKAADRGAKLTHRLLAFARRQPLQAQAIDLNEAVVSMGMMLTRTLGDDVSLTTTLADDLWLAMADPSQIEDALLNLAVNARDAMPRGGQLIIETSNIRVEAEDAAVSADLAEGDYVSLVVSDTGEGMTPDVAARAIEPFFSTKEVGQGTGLGLSMVYGFIKQSSGHLVIYSELGFGTSVKLYLPRSGEGQRATGAADTKTRALMGQGETILVVEDDVDVRAMAASFLEGLGYKVRIAPDGPAAMHVLREHDDIDLVFTDLMMPGGMSGIDLVNAARQQRPGLRVLMTSGYPAKVIENRGGGAEVAMLLGKPYRRRELSIAIRKALETPV